MRTAFSNKRGQRRETGNLVSAEYDAELLVGLVTKPRIWPAPYCHSDFSICRFLIGSFLHDFESLCSEQLKIRWLLPWQSLWWLRAAVVQCGLLRLWSTSGLSSGSLKVPVWLRCLSSLLEPKTQLKKKIQDSKSTYLAHIRRSKRNSELALKTKHGGEERKRKHRVSASC